MKLFINYYQVLTHLKFEYIFECLPGRGLQGCKDVGDRPSSTDFNISKCLPVTRGAVHDCGKTSEEVIQGAETEKTAEKFEYQAVIFMLILLYLWFTNIKLMATCSIY